jgi:circadian clock protein KaiC
MGVDSFASAAASGRESTGVHGLDDILRGGLPSGRVYLVKGAPGAGKTTLALQFLLEGVRRGHRCLYITLSETQDELKVVAESHGWSLEGVVLFELRASDLTATVDAPYTMYHPAEIELKEVMHMLLAEVARVRPVRVVFDSLSEIRLLAQQPLRYRRQILALKQHFAGTDCTVLLLDDNSAVDGHLESLAHGVVALERRSPIYGGAKRRLEVAKLRGVQFRDGFHDFAIHRGGLQVYPRLVASEHREPHELTTIPSGVATLDELLGGGIHSGTATLVIGPAGSGKSALASQYAVAMASRGMNVAVYTFDESIGTMMARSSALKVPLKQHVDSGRVRIQQVDPAEMSPGQFAHQVRDAVETFQARMIVIDSLTGYLNAMLEENFLLNQLHELLTYLGQRGIATIMIATQHGLIGNMATPVDVSYLADTVMLLRYFESGGRVRNAIAVIKKRSGAHERTLREFALGSGGVQIGAPLHHFRGVLTGVPTYTGQPDPLFGVDGGADS